MYVQFIFCVKRLIENSRACHYKFFCGIAFLQNVAKFTFFGEHYLVKFQGPETLLKQILRTSFLAPATLPK